MEKCKHTDVVFVETIKAFHQRVFEGDEYFINNEYGGQLKVHVTCLDCNIARLITDKNQDKLPKWVTSKIQILKKKNHWFFT